MLIWTGWGILLLPITIVSIGLTIFIWSDVLGLNETTPFISNFWYLLAFSLAGVLAWYVGKRLNRPSNDQVYIHKQTGQEVQFRARHSFFFIRLEYWGIILPIIGMIAYITSSV